ncbi:MAG: QcrA and Rieske domain-containing protein [Planctomycetota bacterium]
MFVGTLDSIPVGKSLIVKDLRGQETAITRTSDDRDNPAAGFRALSSKCPHLGCKVHYVEGNQEFFCPWHNGVFDHNGIALAGPPAARCATWVRCAIACRPRSMVGGSRRARACLFRSLTRRG